MKYVKGDLLKAEEKYIAHGCNAQGVMGSGVAKVIKEKWPKAYKDYLLDLKAINETRDRSLGAVLPSIQRDDKVILNLITQEFFGTEKRQVNYAALITSLTSSIIIAEELDGKDYIGSKDLNL